MGPQVGEGKKSLALRLSFRSPDRTLNEAEVNDLRSTILAAVSVTWEPSFGADQREPRSLGGPWAVPFLLVLSLHAGCIFMHWTSGDERFIVITASIVGATGYTGAVLTDILDSHPDVRLGTLTSKSYVGKKVCDVFPHLRVEGAYSGYSLESTGRLGCRFRLLSTCRVASRWWPSLVDGGCRVVDLSADFRLKDPAAYSDVVRFRASARRPGEPRRYSGCPS